MTDEDIAPEAPAPIFTVRAVGYRLHDVDAAWQRFAQLRSVYAPWLNRASKVLAIPPAPWIGDRSYLPHRAPRPRSSRARA